MVEFTDLSYDSDVSVNHFVYHVVNWYPGISLVGASIALMPHVNTIPSVFPASPENPLSAANLLNPGAKVLLIEQISPIGALRKMSTCV